VIVDSSAIVALVFQEPGYERLLDALSSAPSPGIGTPTLAETAIVLSARLEHDATALLDRLVGAFGIAIVPFGDAHWREATDAYWRFGRGRHAAQLNFGDCLTYAVAKLADQPLLFVGEDFTRTDLTPA